MRFAALKVDVDIREDQKFQTNFINSYADLEVLSINMSNLASAMVMHVSAYPYQ